MKKTTFLSAIFIITIYGCNSSKSESLKQLREGKKHYQIKNYDSSITFLTKALVLDSLNSGAYYFFGKINYEINNYSEGLKYLSLARKHALRSDSLAFLRLKILSAMGNYDEFIQYNNELISKNPSNYKLYFNKARALHNKSYSVETNSAKVDLLKEAFENINISIGLNNTDNEIFVLRGVIRYALSDNYGALDDLNTAIKQEKQDSSIISIAYRYKGLTQVHLNNFTNAESLLDSAILYEKGIAVLYYNRGNVRIRLNKINLACDDYRKALELGENEAIDRIRENCK